MVAVEGIDSAPIAHDPVMPHLLYPNRAEMDRRHPRPEAADDVEGNEEAPRDLEDGIFMHGQEIIEDIRGDLIANGRRRRTVE